MGEFKVAFRRPAKYSLIDKAIAYFDGKGEFCHAELVWPDMKTTFRILPRYGCHFAFNQVYDSNWELVTVTLRDDDVMAACQMINGDRYDYLGVLRFICRWLKTSIGRWFCSEGTAKLITVTGGPFLIKPNLLGPNELNKDLKTNKNSLALIYRYMSQKDIDDDKFNNWIDQWEKSQDIFKDAPGRTGDFGPPIEASDPADSSFFGMTQTKPSRSLNNADTEYWKKVADLSAQGHGPDEMIHEMLKPDKVDLGKKANKIASNPNPIPSWTLGKDSEPQVGENVPTYSEDDLNELADLKVKLQELESKMSVAEFKGEKTKKFDEQMQSLKKQIDDLSDLVSSIYSPNPNGGK